MHPLEVMRKIKQQGTFRIPQGSAQGYQQLKKIRRAIYSQKADRAKVRKACPICKIVGPAQCGNPWHAGLCRKGQEIEYWTRQQELADEELAAEAAAEYDRLQKEGC